METESKVAKQRMWRKWRSNLKKKEENENQSIDIFISISNKLYSRFVSTPFDIQFNSHGENVEIEQNA